MSVNKESEAARLSDELTRVFAEGSVFSASDDDLNRYLKHLCTEYVSNNMVQHRAINRCQVINTVKTFRFIDSIEKTNKILTGIIIILTVATLVLAYISMEQSKKSSQQMEMVIHSIEEKYELVSNNLAENINEQNKQIQLLIEQHGNLIEKLKSLYSERMNKQNASNK